MRKDSFKGIEFDLRSSEKKIIIQHDAFKKGLEFFANLKHFKNFFLLIDIKSTDIYHRVINFLKKKKTNFLLLNLNQPELLQAINDDYGKYLFLRFSLFENFNLNQKKFKKVGWVWFDFFDNHFISSEKYRYIKKFKKKICLTSPDLVGQNENIIKKFIFHLNKNKIKVDMVCVKQKNLKIWKKYYKY